MIDDDRRPIRPAGLAAACLLLAACDGSADAGRADTGADPRRRSGALDLVQILAPAISGAHLLGGSFDDAQRLYVAGFQQGLVTFQFGDAPAVPDPDAVWRAHEGSAVCARMLQTGARAFCTSHTPELWRFDHDAVLGRVSGVRRVPSPAQVALEGMTLVGGTVYVAARSFGLLSHPLDAPPDAGLTPVPVDGALGDAWDVKRLDDDHLVVADGRNGLRVLGRAAGGPAPWRVVGAVPLAGLSAFVTVVGSRAYVAALSGGAHVVELSRPASPERVGTVETGDVVYAAHPAGDMVVVANGGDLLVAAATAEPPRMAIVGRRESVGTALGVTVDRHGVVTSTEFSVVGRYLLRPERAAGAVLQVDRYVLIPRLAPGQAYTAEVTLRNLGDAPLALGGATLTDNLSRSARSIGGPATVAPGDPYVLRVPLTGDAASGARDYLVEVTTAAGGRYPVPLDPFGGLFPGDRLPADLRLRDAAMREHDVNAEFASRVGVLIVAAASCPVAYYALHALALDLEPLLSRGLVATLSIDPWADWSTGGSNESRTLRTTFPHLLSDPLGPGRNLHDEAPLLALLGRGSHAGLQMPVVYVVDRRGVIRYAEAGYRPGAVLDLLHRLIAEP